jgi:hypothetical protein
VETVDYALFQPLVFGAILYVVLFVAAAVLDARGAEERAEGLRDISFLIVLLAAAWVVVLVLVALVDVPGLIVDLLTIIAVIGVFFGLLLFAFFGVFELMIGRGPRRAAGRDNG